MFRCDTVAVGNDSERDGLAGLFNVGGMEEISLLSHPGNKQRLL